MPRLPPSLLRLAQRQHPFLALLLRECRDLQSARNELRWLAEDADGLSSAQDGHDTSSSHFLTSSKLPRPGTPSWRKLHHNVLRRASGEPLQYILGTAPFKELEILCRREVLIPRWETEVYTEKIGKILRANSPDRTPLRILDLCTGTGCIALLLHSLLRPAPQDDAHQDAQNLKERSIEITAVDVSPASLRLASLNVAHNVQLGTLHPSAAHDISIRHLDVLELARALAQPNLTEVQQQDLLSQAALSPPNHDPQTPTTYDLVISNPPYISPAQYRPGGTAARSVRNHEPRSALVPPPDYSAGSGGDDENGGDAFYPAILSIASAVRTTCVVMEVGDAAQAARVARFAGAESGGARIEIWDDEGAARVWSGGDGDGDDRGKRVARTQDQDRDAVEDRAVVIWKGVHV